MEGDQGTERLNNPPGKTAGGPESSVFFLQVLCPFASQQTISECHGKQELKA